VKGGSPALLKSSDAEADADTAALLLFASVVVVVLAATVPALNQRYLAVALIS
jgi:hypothetical protein